MRRPNVSWFARRTVAGCRNGRRSPNTLFRIETVLGTSLLAHGGPLGLAVELLPLLLLLGGGLVVWRNARRDRAAAAAARAGDEAAVEQHRR